MLIINKLLGRPCCSYGNWSSFTTSVVFCKKNLTNLKGKSKSSQDWLTRQLNDPYVKLAKKTSYRARSAFKILEIDDRFKILKPGQIVIECGAAPGAWTQVIVPRINSLPHDETKKKGIVIGIDISSIYPLPGAVFLNRLDFTTSEAHEKICDILDGKKVDVVLSDMAPNATGLMEHDRFRIFELCESALTFAVNNSKKDATFLCKVWMGDEMNKLYNKLQIYYDVVKFVKPPCSRKDSSETFILAKQFKGVT